MHRVYTLQHPKTREVRYVGVTSLPLERRLAGHLHMAKTGATLHVSNWIRSLGKNAPIIELQGEYEHREEALAAEIAYIKTLRQHGYDLTNLTKGGEGHWGWVSHHKGVPLPKEASARISIPLRTKKASTKPGAKPKATTKGKR